MKPISRKLKIVKNPTDYGSPVYVDGKHKRCACADFVRSILQSTPKYVRLTLSENKLKNNSLPIRVSTTDGYLKIHAPDGSLYTDFFTETEEVLLLFLNNTTTKVVFLSIDKVK